jgi:hypothetical protein
LILLSGCGKKNDDIVSVINGVSVYNNSAVPQNPSFSYEFIEDGIIPFTDGENNDERNFKQPSAVIEDNR